MSQDKKQNIAVTGLNATDNPGPGITVIRALRHDPDFDGRIVGLAYDTLDPGIYARDLVDDVFLIPYPSQGVEALETRLRYIHDKVGGLDVIMPTLDAELAAFIELEPVLQELGIGTFLPTRAQLDCRSKVKLAELGASAGIKVPATRVVSSVDDLYTIHEQVPFPLWIKGAYYGATLARTVHEAIAAFHKVVATWGYPVIAQTGVAGDELNVVALGDGEGGLVGAVPMKKTTITDKGKGWAGIAIKDPELIDITRRFIAETRWRGPCEVEVIKDQGGVPPTPLDATELDGKLSLEVTPELHRELLFLAKADNIELSLLVNDLLVRAVSRRWGGARRAHGGGGNRQQPKGERGRGRPREGQGNRYHNIMEDRAEFIDYVRKLDGGGGRPNPGGRRRKK